MNKAVRRSEVSPRVQQLSCLLSYTGCSDVAIVLMQ